jgi:hypothetical protein
MAKVSSIYQAKLKTKIGRSTKPSPGQKGHPLLDEFFGRKEPAETGSSSPTGKRHQ